VRTGAVVMDSGDWRPAAVAIGLSLAGAAAPIAVALAALTDPQQWRPTDASTLVALLVVAPAGAGLAAMLSGLRRLAALAREAGGETEQAVLRILVAVLMFGYALILPAIGAGERASADCVAVAASELVFAWTLLLCVVLWPASRLRRLTATVCDLSLLSAFLHFGGGPVAGWFPLYIIVVLCAGLRFGLAALMSAAATAIIGFAAVAVSTAAWREQPALAAGLLLALVVLPAPIAQAARRLAAARSAAANAEADWRRMLLAISGSLTGSAAARPAAPWAASIADVLDFAALETGTFAAPVETFELRSLIRRRLAPLQADAAERGVALRWRIAPHLPNRLRGHAQVLERIVRGLAEYAIAAAPPRPVRLTVDAGPRDRDRLRLDLRVEAGEEDGPGADGEPLALRLVRKLAATAGGSFLVDRVAGERNRLLVQLPLAIEEGASTPALDLDGRSVLIVTEDRELADELAAPLAAWNSEPRWPPDADQAIAELAVAGEAKRAVVVIDGRDRLLWALGVAHQAAKLGVHAPFVLLIADAGQIAGLLAVDDGGLDGIIPAPPSVALIANALDALPLAPERPPPSPEAEAAARRPRRQTNPAMDPLRRDPAQITPIAAHPKFAPDAAAVDARALEGLQALGGDERFLSELIEAFRLDAAHIMERIASAALAADNATFAHGLVALRRAAGQLGGVQLCALTASLQHLSANELRQRGSLYVQRLDVEIERLTEALTAFAAEKERRS
jgi:signal transduction histidine kinase